MKTITVMTLVLLFACMPAVYGADASDPHGDDQLVGLVKLNPSARISIDKGLRYLAKSQQADGSWGRTTRAADTSVALMAFMLQGHVPGRGKYGHVMDKGIAYLIKLGNEGGGYLGTPSNHAGMYEHGLAILALSEAWGQSKNPKLRNTLRKAVDITLRAQNKQGGWRYTPEPADADVSMTVMQTVALNSAKESGIAVPQKSIDRAAKYVMSCQNQAEGGFGYTDSTSPGFPRSAAGTMALIMCGKGNSIAVRRGMAYVKNHPDAMAESRFFYAQYYAMQCMYQSGEKEFRAWYPKVAKRILAKQSKDGSWGDKQGNGGKGYGTGMAILILGVPYRYLPIYQR